MVYKGKNSSRLNDFYGKIRNDFSSVVGHIHVWMRNFSVQEQGFLSSFWTYIDKYSTSFSNVSSPIS